ncbi:MAG: glycoside hydrolase family 97 protein [Bacteroidetes bacterium]|nr:MAG: glycoside hydrolase family 97 protein [Bacteroidota bacterium]
MRKPLLLLSLCLSCALLSAQTPYRLSSPDGHISAEIATGTSTSYAVFFKGKPILLPSPLSMTLQNGLVLGGNARVKKAETREVRDTIRPALGEKRALIPDHYRELRLPFKEGYSLVFRAYNDGLAWRWETNFADSVVVMSEQAAFHLPGNPQVYFPEIEPRLDADVFHTSFEVPYKLLKISEINPKGIAYTPLLTLPEQGPKLLITESDLESYPGMFLRGTEQGLEGVFAGYPLKEEKKKLYFEQMLVTERAPYIARCAGRRTYPWRVLVVAEHDRTLPESDLVYRLASPCRIADPSWIQPGVSTEEWIVAQNLYHVPFKAGVNTETYKYYIDFAARFGLEYVMLDNGWSADEDLFRIRPGMDMEEIVRYAKSKGIRLVLWTLANTIDHQLDSALAQFRRWEVACIMVDFMDRDDQKMVDFYFRIAEACAREKIMVMFHGAFKPAGFTRTWPNAITREGAMGSEFNLWSEKASPDHDLILPFTRMVSGPMDYEPGLLNNANKETFRPLTYLTMSQGTRSHQLAMFVCYDSPLQMFSGNPSDGYRDPDFMEFLGDLPSSWDDTRILEAAVSDYLVTARRKGNEWYIGAMCDWTARDMSLDLSFLGPGTWEIQYCGDGVNADRYAADYTIQRLTLPEDKKLQIHLAPGGGYVAKIYRKE